MSQTNPALYCSKNRTMSLIYIDACLFLFIIMSLFRRDFSFIQKYPLQSLCVLGDDSTLHCTVQYNET